MDMEENNSREGTGTEADHNYETGPRSILDRFPDLIPQSPVEVALTSIYFDNRLNGAAKSMGTKAFMEYITRLGVKARSLDRIFIESLNNTEDTTEVLPGETCLSRLPYSFPSFIDSNSYLFILTETCKKVSSLYLIRSLLRGIVPRSYQDVLLAITGSGGCGKSYVLQYLVRLLRTSPGVKTFYLGNPSLIFSNFGVKNLELIILELVFSLAEECPDDLGANDTGKTYSYKEFLDRMANYYDILKKSQGLVSDMNQPLQILSEAFSYVEQYCSSRGYLFIKVTDQRNTIAACAAENGKSFDNDIKKRLEKIIISPSGNVFSLAAESFMSESIDHDMEKVEVETYQCFSDASILKLRDEIWGSPEARQGPHSLLPELENAAIFESVVDRIGRSPLILRKFFDFFAGGDSYLDRSLDSFERDFISETEEFTILEEQRRFVHEKGQECLVLFMLADCAPPLTSSGVSIANTRFIHPAIDGVPFGKRCKPELQIFDFEAYFGRVISTRRPC